MGERSGRTRGAQRCAPSTIPAATCDPIPSGIAWIRGFDFNFRSDDHHIQEVGVYQPGDGRLEVYYSDKNQDDEFDWRVRWAVR
jgi:hypothetical protein